MNIPDLINSLYEFCGGFVIILSIIKLHRDKMVKGVHWIQILFFMSWGYWNLFYYFHLDQFMSWIAGMFIVATNTIWFLQMIYYIRKEKNELHRKS